MSISYLYDYDQFFTPEITLKRYQLIDEDYISALPISGPEKEMLRAQSGYRVERFELRRLRAHRIGADIKGTIGECGAWLEACYTITEDSDRDSDKRRNPNLSWTMKFDNYYGPHESYYINMQYF